MKTENNKIIAEFMGLKPIEVFGSSSISKDHVSVNCKTEKEAFESFCKSTKFHSDWNWLMEVVTEIENLGYRVKITRHICRIKHIVISEDLPKIQSVYKACVDFIQWYNQQQQQQQQPKQYPFNRDDDYWVIEDGEIWIKHWNSISERIHDENPDKIYYKSEQDAHEALLNIS